MMVTHFSLSLSKAGRMISIEMGPIQLDRVGDGRFAVVCFLTPAEVSYVDQWLNT